MSNGKQGNSPANPSFAFGNSAALPAKGDPAGRTSRDVAHRVHAPGVADRLAQIPEAPVQTFVPEPTAKAATLEVAKMDQPAAKVSDIPRSSPDYLSAGTPIERSVRDGPTGVRHEEIQTASAEAVVSDVEIDEFERKHRLIDFIWDLVTFRWLRALLHGSRELIELREQVKKFEDYRVEFEGRLDSQGQMIADQRMRMDERVRAIVQSMVPDLTPTLTRLNALESELKTKLEQLSKQPESVPAPVIATSSEELKALQARVTELDAHSARLSQELRKEMTEKVETLRKTLDDTFARTYQTDLPLWLSTQLGPMVAEEIKARRSLAPLDGNVADDIYNQLEMMGDDLAKLEDRLDSNEPHMLSVMRLGHDLERRLQSSEAVNRSFTAGRTMIETPLPANLSTPIAEALRASAAEASPVANPDLEHAFMASEPASGEQPVLTQEQLDAEFASKPSVESTAPAGVSAYTYNGRSEADTGMSDEEFARELGIKSTWSTASKIAVVTLVAIALIAIPLQVARSNWFQSLAESARKSSVDGGKVLSDPRTKPLKLEAPAVDPSAVSVDSGIDYPLTGKHNLNSSERLQKAQQQSQPAADPSVAKPPRPKSILGEPKKKGIERKLDSLKKESRADEGVVKDYSKLSSTEEALRQFQRDVQDEMNGKKAEEPQREPPTIIITPKWNQLERPKEPKISAQALTLSVSPTPCPLVLHEGEPNEECVR